MGWAERIIGKPEVETTDPENPPVVSYVSGEEKASTETDDDERFRCSMCGTVAEIGTMCQTCGDTLPTRTDQDPYIWLVLRNSLHLILAPRHYAVNLPYPIKGGNLQPVLYPGIFAAFFVIALPFSRASVWLYRTAYDIPIEPSLIAIPMYVLGIPILVFLSAGLAYMVARMLGGHASFSRTVRALSGGLIILLIIGIFRFVLGYIAIANTRNIELILERLYNPVEVMTLVQYGERMATIFTIFIAGWYYAWIVGGLHRLAWWKTIVHTLATYVAVLFWIWLYILQILPLNAGHLL